MTDLVLEYPLDSSQTERLLKFCLEIDVDRFSVHFIYGNQDERQRVEAVTNRLAPFSLGKRLLEQTVWRNDQHFIHAECWSLNPDTIRIILDACEGSLSNYNMGRIPEDWTFYRKAELLLGFVSHEQYAFIQLSDEELEIFKRLNINFTMPETDPQPGTEK